MECPRCGGKDREDRHITNLGGKEHYERFDTRRYECDVCGLRFMTVEQYHRVIHPQPDPPDVPAPDLHADGY